MSKSGSKYRAWIRPFRHCWKLLVWIWGVLILSVIINDGSSWLITKGIDVNGTPLGWLAGHFMLMLPLIGALILITGIGGLAHHQAKVPAIQATPQLVLTLQQRLRFIRSFQQEYSRRLAHSLQGRGTLELGLHERTDVIASSAELVFHHTDTATEYPLPSSTSIIQAYDQAQRGLLILGAPGSGKSTLLLNLAIELLQRAENDLDHPIPIILNLSSWAEKKLPLADWFCEQCLFVYGIPKGVSVSWIATDQVLLLLDGLDEVEASARSTCLDTINLYRGEHLNPFVVCSRSLEYENLQARLILPAAIEIQPLEVAQTAAYLKQAGKSLAAVRKVLRSNTSLQQLITTPLILTIVLLTYQDKAVKDLPQRGTPEDQQRHIFVRYVEHVLERKVIRSDFTPQQTKQWLIWLAQQMQQRHLSEFYLERLQSTWLPTKRTQILYYMLNSLAIGLLAWLLMGFGLGLIFGPIVGLVAGAAVGVIIGPVLGARARHQEIRPKEMMKWSWKQFWQGTVIGLVSLGVIAGLFAGLIIKPGAGVGTGLVSGLIGGPLLGLLFGLSNEQISEDVRIKPNQGIYSSGWNALRIGLVVGLAVGLVFSLGFGLVAGLGAGLLLGQFLGLSFGGKEYLQHYLLRYLLWRSGAMPWPYVRFLENANERILLQRVGGGYRFIHPLFQDYFASLASSPTIP